MGEEPMFGAGMGLGKSIACERAKIDANAECQNEGCPDGCADLLDCDCSCLVDDVTCICVVFVAELCKPGDVPKAPGFPECDPAFQSCLTPPG
jgi:hypothetical protein